MPSVSGKLLYNAATPENPQAAFYGIANVPIVLQGASGAALAVLTDGGGNYRFLNVPDGEYTILEAYGFTPSLASPGDFSGALTLAQSVAGSVPPLSLIPARLVPDGRDSLYSAQLSMPVTVGGGDVTVSSIVNTPYQIALQNALIVYELEISNDGPDAAENVSVTDVIPDELDAATAEYSLDGGETWSAWTGSVALGTLESGESRVLLVRGVVNTSASGFIINDASTVSGETPDPDLANNATGLAAIIADQNSFTISKTASSPSAYPGEQITFEITATNIGANTAQNAAITDTLPSGLINAEYSYDGGETFLPWSGIYYLPAMPPGESATIIIRAQVAQSARGRLTDTASVGGDILDPAQVTSALTILRAPVTPEREGVINEILSSVAMEELSLSHILNAEGEKLQFILGTLPGLRSPAPTIEEVLAANRSVRDTLNSISRYQVLLVNKMKNALKASDL